VLEVLTKKTGIYSKYRDGFTFRFFVEQIKCPETLFQPCLVGKTIAGLGETIGNCLQHFTQEEKKKLIKNVLVSGGCGNWRGFARRVKREIESITPTGSEIRVQKATHPSLDAFRGLTLIAEDPTFSAISREDYFEYGSEYLKEHRLSNTLYQRIPIVKDVHGKRSAR